MKGPTTMDLEECKRVGRLLRERPVGAIVFEPSTLHGDLEVFCDANHAGDLDTRKSRSGTALMSGSHLIKHKSAVRSTTALSSGESEYNALLRTSGHALATKAILKCEIHIVPTSKNLLDMFTKSLSQADTDRSMWETLEVGSGRHKAEKHLSSKNIVHHEFE